MNRVPGRKTKTRAFVEVLMICLVVAAVALGAFAFGDWSNDDDQADCAARGGEYVWGKAVSLCLRDGLVIATYR